MAPEIVLGIFGILEIIPMIIQIAGAPRDAETLKTELRSLETFLSQMKTNITSDPDFEKAICDQSSELRQIVDTCTVELKALIDKLKRREDDGSVVWNRLTESKVARDTQKSLDRFHRHCRIASDMVAIDVAGEVRKIRKEQQEWHETVRGREILQWLSPLNFQERQRDIFAKRYPETGSWFLNLDEFRSWRDGDATKSSTLWCPGIPGAGKTVMTSIVLNHLRETFIDKGFAFAFVYCDYRDLKNQTASNLISSLVQQLAQQKSCIPEEIGKAFADHGDGKRAPRLDEYTRLLQSLSTCFPRTFILIDALDECSSGNQEDRSHRQVLLDVLLELQQFSSGCSLFITSRINGQIEEKLAKYTRIEIRATDEDVGFYIRSRITDSSKFRFAEDVGKNPDLGKTIVAKLVENAKGMFLLPRLHLDLLGSQTSVRRLRRALNYLPTELDDTYDSAMTRVQAQTEEDRALAMQTLSWISHALRPLRMSELQHALAVEPGDRNLDAEGIPPENLLISVCAGLISIDAESSTVGLVHFTVEEYFKSTRQKWFPNAAVHMAKTCLTYISFNAFSGGSCSNDQELDERLYNYPFLQYAVRNWGIHAHDDPDPETKEAAQKFLEDKSKLSSFIQARDCPPYRYAGFSQRFTKGVTGLQIASAFGLTEIASLLLKDGADVKARDEYGCTALHWAAKNGHEAVVDLLLEKMDEIDYKQGEAGWRALYWAAKNGHEAVVRLLIKRGTNIANAWDEEGRTAMHWAAVNGHEAVVRLLLEGGADIEEVDQQGVTPLHWAAKGGSEAVVQLLLEKGGNVEARDNDGRTPLHRAAENGHGRVIQLLVENRANAKAEDIYGRIVLCVAIWHEKEAAARLLAPLTPPDLKLEALSVLESRNPRVQAFAYRLLLSA